MSKFIQIMQKKRGRPATGKDPIVPVRMPIDLIGQIEAWARHQETTRSEAIRCLVEQALTAVKAKKEFTS